MKLRKTTEDYLKTIYILNKKNAGVHSVTIAEHLGVSRPTVSTTVKRLVNDGYITINDEHEIFLTNAGIDVAQSTLEKHKTLQNLLGSLGVDRQTAEKDACEIEHNLSYQSFMALKSFLNNQQTKSTD